MSDEVRYYKGKHKVKVVNESKGYWTVETLEQFEDVVNGVEVVVKVGERRIVPSSSVHKSQSIPPPIKEHSYELRMEKRLKRMVAEEQKEKKRKTVVR